MKYEGREGGIWRLNAQDFEIGRVDEEVKALPGSPKKFTTDLYVAGVNGEVGIGTTSPAGRLSISEAMGTEHGVGKGTIIIDHDNAGGASSIVFRSKRNPTSDYGFIQYQDDATIGSTGEANRLIIGTMNDVDDHLILQPSGNVGISTTDPKTKLDVNGGLNVTGNVGIGTSDPKAKLTVQGDLIRKVAIATGIGPTYQTGSKGQIKSRVLKFTKQYPDTAIRILYCDNFRVAGTNVAARWEIRVDGRPPSGGAIYQDKYCSSGNYHEPATILGYAIGISAGDHEIQVWIGPVDDRGFDAVTGWSDSRWTIEAQEVWIKPA